MAAEVAVAAHENFQRMQIDLQNQELDSPGGVATAQQYTQLLALHLLHNEICEAKFVWKRIPAQIKTSTPELTNVWAVGQKIWQRDFPGIYEAFNKEWSESLKPVMDALLAATRKRAFNLVAQAYDSINVDDLAAFVGMPSSEAAQAVQKEGWDADPQTRFITPRKPCAVVDPVLVSEQQLSVLTDYVSFLES
ncbi:COP9 signalosome complex subunit 8-like [Mytilus californianus]|uniref:COP9 signalosome complex subunit 8-like n=1 Tax=Mytilus californianus TaxID=6549 RepID=UPI002247D68B|nr:COP9 signalosome complex subunit 8-like [Mytilus californianus]